MITKTKNSTNEKKTTKCSHCGKKFSYIFHRAERKYCSEECRQDRNAKKYRGYKRDWQKDKRGKFGKGKKKCPYCLEEGKRRYYKGLNYHIGREHKGRPLIKNDKK